MPSATELRNLDMSRMLVGGLNRFNTAYGAGEDEERLRRMQSFMQMGEAAGQPVTSMPSTGGGLFGDILRGVGLIPKTTQATPQELSAEKLAIQDRELAKILAVSQLAGRIDPQGIAALSKIPGMEQVLGGVTPDIASHFITPTDIRQQMAQDAATARAQQNQFMNEERSLSREERVRHDREMEGLRAESMSGAAANRESANEMRSFTMDYRKKAQEDTEDQHVNTVLNNRIRQSGMTNPQERAQWEKVQSYYDDNRAMGMNPQGSFNNAIQRVKQETKMMPATLEGGGTLSGMLRGWGFGGGSPGPAAPTGTGASTLPPLPSSLR